VTSVTKPGYRPAVSRPTSSVAAVLCSSLASVTLVAAATSVTAAAAPSATSAASTATIANTPQARRKASQVLHTSWSGYRDWKAGKRQRTRISQGRLWINGTPRVRKLAGKTWDTGRWVSPWAETGFAASSLIPSWEADIPGRGMVRIEVRARDASGRVGSWDTVADWSLRDKPVSRRTYSGQTDDLGRVSVDTWLAATSVVAWQTRVTLARPRGSDVAISVRRVGGVASTTTGAGPTSKPGPAAGKVLPVPAYSQMVHQGHYPQWGGGGEAWCSPTSTAMVLAYYGIHPTPSGITAGHTDAVVDHTARMVYDHAYRGTGNWAFNTAYAATLVGGDSYVTRLRDLREAEDFIAIGVPLIVSVAFGRNQLAGAPISTSNGHLLVIAGFEADGDVVVNDPAGATNGAVRRVYDRAQFERVWLNASGGTAYVIKNG
jgi:hypothetical protein